MNWNHFISADFQYCDLKQWVNAPYIRKSFQVAFLPEKAEVTVCTTGFYELFLNGQKITKGEMAPYISNPDHICYYDTYDISTLLTEGENVIGVILGNGFANQCIDSWQFSKAPFRAPLCVAMKLTACGEGKNMTMETDETFKTHPSPVLFDMYRYGMHYDARLEVEDWCKPGFDDSHWQPVHYVKEPKGEKLLCKAQPVKAQYELAPRSIVRQEDFYYLHRSTAEDAQPMKETYVKEGWLYDFGVSRAGVCRLKITGEKGQKITLRHCETLRNGNFNLNSIYTFKENYHGYIHLFQTDTYILKGGEEEIFTPFFTYHGFRYVLVEGITEEQADKSLLTFVVMNSDIPRRAQFTCSDEILNTLYDMGVHADLSNFVYFPTDCPHREKNGWTGDAAVSASQLLLNFDCSESLRVWMENIRRTQLDSGMIPCIVPTSGWGYTWGNGPAWDWVIVNLPYYALKYDGRLDIIEENADMIYRYLTFISTTRDERGLVKWGLGDWCQPGWKNRSENILSPLEYTSSCVVYDMALKSRLMFTRIGRSKEAEYAGTLAEEMRSAIREHLVDKDNLTAAGACQTSQALGLALGIFTEEEYEGAYRRLIELIEEKDRHVYCGMIGLRYIFHVLFENGDGSLAYEMITREDEPSYGSMIKRGGTALFESLFTNGVQESQNHAFFGDILNLFISRLAGLIVNPDMDDKNKILVAPHIIPQVQHAEAFYDTDCGRVRVSWERLVENSGKQSMEQARRSVERVSDEVVIVIEVPKGVHGELLWEEQYYVLQEGKNKKHLEVWYGNEKGNK